VLTVQLRRTLAHELDHAARVTAGPGYGSTLLDVMVSEGLADNFATSLYRGSRHPWTHALSARDEHRLWQRAQQHLYEISSGARRSWAWFIRQTSGDILRLSDFSA